MKRFSIIFVALFPFLSGLWAQEGTANSLRISWGMGNLKKQDLIFSPFINQAWSPVNFALNYDRSRKLEQRAYFRFGQYSTQIGDLYSYILNDETWSKYPHSFTQVDLNYSLGIKIVANEQMSFIVGGRYRNRFRIAYYDFGPGSHFAYHIPIGLDAWFNLKVNPARSRHHFETNLNLPLFSYVAHSPYMGQDDGYLERISVHGDLKIFIEHLKSGELESWGTSQIIDMDLGYGYALSGRWEIGAHYLFSMDLHSTPAKYTSYENLFLAGITLKF